MSLALKNCGLVDDQSKQSKSELVCHAPVKSTMNGFQSKGCPCGQVQRVLRRNFRIGINTPPPPLTQMAMDSSPSSCSNDGFRRAPTARRCGFCSQDGVAAGVGAETWAGAGVACTGSSAAGRLDSQGNAVLRCVLLLEAVAVPVGSRKLGLLRLLLVLECEGVAVSRSLHRGVRRLHPISEAGDLL